jgi:hypothetical protein
LGVELRDLFAYTQLCVSLIPVFFVLLAAGAAAAIAWAAASDRRAREAQRAHDDTVVQLNLARDLLTKAQQSEAALRARLDAEQRNAADSRSSSRRANR